MTQTTSTTSTRTPTRASCTTCEEALRARSVVTPLDVCVTSLTSYEPNDMVFSELVNSQGSFSYITPSSDLDIDDTTLGKLLTEAHREHADYRNPEGVSVSQSSLSVVFDRTGKPVGENSSNAQIRTLLDEQRQMIIAEYCELVITNSKQLEPKKNAEFYEKNYGVSKWIFVKFINKVLPRWRN